MKTLAFLAGVFVVAGLGYLYLTAPGLAIGLTIVVVGLLVVYGGLVAAIYAYHRLGQARLVNAQAFATTIEAAKIPDNIQGLALPTNSRVNITILPTRPAPVIAAPSIVAELPAQVEARPIDLPAANFFDYVGSNPFRKGELFLTLGVGAGGTAITKPITKLTHFLPAGKTNSGKSTFLRSLAAQALIGELAAPDRARVALVDLSGITFNPDLFAGLPQTWGGGVVQSDTGAIKLVTDLLAECERRARLYSQAPGLPESLPEYNAVVPPTMRLPVILTFIEEMSALSEFAGKPFLSPLKQLLWTARKFGIYLANAGQDFRANVIDKSITDNSSSRFLFGGVDDTTARVIGFDPKQHRVSVDQPGRGLVMLNKQVQEFQGLFLDKPGFVALVNQLRVNAGLPEVGRGQMPTGQNQARPATTTAYQGRFRGETNDDTFRAENASEGFSARPSNGNPGEVVTATYRELPAAPSEVDQAVRAYHQGATSVRKLVAALGVTHWKATQLMQELKRMGVYPAD